MIEPGRFRLQMLDARSSDQVALTARSFAELHGAAAVVNGSFFLQDRTPLGLVVADGVQLNPLRKADWGVFYVSDGRARLVHTRDYDPQTDVEQAIQAGPRLVVEGQPLELKPQVARRTFLGIDEAGRIYLGATVDGAAHLGRLAEVLSLPPARGGLGLSYALNLDGGPSTQLYAERGDLHLDIRGQAVPIAVAVFPRDGEGGGL